MAEPNVIVIGGGLAGLMTAIEAAESGCHVDLVSIVPCRRSHSVCAQGGINAAKNIKGEGDHPDIHFDDTVYGGDFLANQPPVHAMCYKAPEIIDLLDRMGVMFNRTSEGLLDFRRFGGALKHRTAYAGATTGQQLIYALDEQVRRYEVDGLVDKWEGFEFMSLVLDDNQVCRGITAMDLNGMKVHVIKGNAVVFATGGPGLIFGKSTNSIINTGAATSRAYQQGVTYANPEFIQVHPTAIPGVDKDRLMSESARGEGGRVWVPGDASKHWVEGDKKIQCGETGQPWYFLEAVYPKYGNLVPRDIATRAIFKVCVELGLGVDGKNQVYLDLTHKDPEELDRKLGGILEIYETFVGEDPRKVPMRIFPSVHYSMGGLWVDFNNLTNLQGVYAAGECNYQYHGANRLGANALLSCIYDGMVAGPQAVEYVRNLENSDAAESVFQAEVKRQEEINERVRKLDGTESVVTLHRELGEWMTTNCTIIRENDKLTEALGKVDELEERWSKINISDTTQWRNATFFYVRQMKDMLVLARLVLTAAIARDESRGAHYKPEFPERDDENWLKTTMGIYAADGPKLDYDEVDVSLIPPRKRSYV